VERNLIKIKNISQEPIPGGIIMKNNYTTKTLKNFEDNYNEAVQTFVNKTNKFGGYETATLGVEIKENLELFVLNKNYYKEINEEISSILSGRYGNTKYVFNRETYFSDEKMTNMFPKETLILFYETIKLLKFFNGVNRLEKEKKEEEKKRIIEDINNLF
jgi:pyruvate/oxaloacetate carboxyltransferase